MTVLTVQQAVRNEEGEHISVHRSPGAADIVVTWFCGDTRTFKPEDLVLVLSMLDKLKPYPDVWLAHKDSYGARFAARIEDGELYANTTPHDGDAGSYHVPWDSVRKALKKAVD